MTEEKLVILGSGPAGLTAAIYAARAHLNPLILEGRMPGGQLMTTSMVENWPGEMSILGPDLMAKLRSQALELGTRFISEEVISTHLKEAPFQLTTHRQKTIQTHALIIATGASAKKLGCPGEDTYWAKGVTTCAVCDGAFYRDKRVIIIGGGDTAMENASFMTNFTKQITIIHILPQLTASRAMQERVIHNKDITIMYESTVTAIEGDGQKVTNIVVTNQQTKEQTRLEADGVFVSIGITPNTTLFKNQIDLDPYGYILLKKNTMTSVPGVFAAGDVADNRYRQAITSAGSGCAALLDAERYLKEHNL